MCIIKILIIKNAFKKCLSQSFFFSKFIFLKNIKILSLQLSCSYIVKIISKYFKNLH